MHTTTTSPTTLRTAQPLMARRLHRQVHHSQLTWHDEDDPQRAEVMRFIQTRFAATYGATVVAFMPILVSLMQQQQRTAVLGLRPASEGPLFLEQYFDAPIESVVQQQVAQPLTRDSLIEVGHLSATHHAASLLLFLTVGNLLLASGFRWLVFTATPTVAQMLGKLQLSLHQLGDADPARLADAADHWGSYYEQKPQVWVGDMASIRDSELAMSPGTSSLHWVTPLSSALMGSLRDRTCRLRAS